MSTMLTQVANPPDNTQYDYRNSIRLQDDFFTGTATTGLIGTLGWVVSNGATTTYLTATADAMGVMLRDTSATINTVAATILSSANSLNPSVLYSEMFRLKMTQADGDTVIWVGAANSSVALVPADGIYFEKRAADTNWFAVTRAATVQTGSRTDTGVAVSTTNYQKLRITRTAANVLFFIDDVLVRTETANITTVMLDPGFVISNTTAVVKTVAVDYFELDITGISR